MATISGDLKTKFTDDLGEPLIGGKVYTYHAGTSTPKDSYQDKEFAIVNSNPIILDDAGSCDLYLKGLYRLRVLDKDGVFVEERDYMTQGDSTGSSITDNANNITVLQSEVQAINERSVLKLDENNFVIGHGSANSATVHDPAFRLDKLKIAKKDDAESAKLLFNTYEANTSVEGETVKEGSYIDPDLITQPLVKNWRDVERAAFKGTKKDDKTNLLLKAGDSVPSNSAASRLVGKNEGELLEAGTGGIGRETTKNVTRIQRTENGFFNYLTASGSLDVSGAPNYQMGISTNWVDNSVGAQILIGVDQTPTLGLRTWDNSTQKYINYRKIYYEGNTKKDSKTNLLLNLEDTVPENSAASKLVGTTNGTVPLVENVQKAMSSYIPPVKFRGQAPLPDDLLAGDMVYYASAVNDLKPDNFGGDYWTLRTFALESGTIRQEAYDLATAQTNVRVRNTVGANQDWSEWRPISTNSFTYRVTTATAANVTVDSTGVLRRASSALKYKDVIAKLELDSDLYDKAMQTKPIIYRSKSEADPKDWHFMSFIAEELGELDPALTQWKTHEINEKGEQVELEEKEAEGINLNAICAVLHATNIYQDKKLKELEARIEALEGK